MNYTFQYLCSPLPLARGWPCDAVTNWIQHMTMLCQFQAYVLRKAAASDYVLLSPHVNGLIPLLERPNGESLAVSHPMCPLDTAT